MKKLLLILFIPFVSFGQDFKTDELKTFMASMYEESNYMEFQDMTTIEIPFVMDPNYEINIFLAL